MKFETFCEYCDFAKKSEREKCELVLFYEKIINKREDLTPNEIATIIENAGFARLNLTRLKSNLYKSRKIVKGRASNSYKLSIVGQKELSSQYVDFNIDSEEIIVNDEILPNQLLNGTRGYIEKIAKQINGSFENNFNDGCAVLMRRLLEILLIMTYQHHRKQGEIQDNQNGYKNLSYIINYTKSNNQFHLSKTAIDCLDIFRILGNFSAHSIEYNCLKKEIKDVSQDFRVTIEELLYKSGIKK